MQTPLIMNINPRLEEDLVDYLLAGLKDNVCSDIVYWEQSISNKGRID